MGAKTWMLVYSDGDARDALRVGPRLDRDATRRLAAALFPDDELEPAGEGDLCFTSPPRDELLIGSFPGVSVVAAKEFAIDRPSRLEPRFLTAATGRNVTLLVMHSVVDWFAYARWSNGELLRSLSVSPDGIREDLGPRMPFEEPYWSGKHPVEDDGESEGYPLPFHPLELGDAALCELFGYQLEGSGDGDVLEPESIALARYRRSRPSWWAFWRRAPRRS